MTDKRIVKVIYTDDTFDEVVNPKPYKVVGAYQQELFSYLHDLGIIALQSEMQEIERIVLSMQQQDKKMYSEDDMINFAQWFSDYEIPKSELISFTNQLKNK